WCAQVCAWTCKTPLKSVGATARRGAGATARRHHPNPAEADRRWRGERSKPVRLDVRDHHTRSLGTESPAQTEQWGCWLCRRRIIFCSKEIATNSCLLGDAAGWPTSVQNACRRSRQTQSRAAYPRRCSSNASGLPGRNSVRILGIRAIFQRDNL